MFTQFYDISQLFHDDMPVYPGDAPYRTHSQYSMQAGDLCNLASLEMSMHCGTHIDAPSHFIADGAAIDEIEVWRFFGKATVWELETKQTVTRDDLEKHRREKSEMVLLKILANHHPHLSLGSNPAYLGLTPDAAAWLVAEHVRLVGINCASVDPAESRDFPAHSQLLHSGVVILENLDLSSVAPGDYYLACFPLKLKGGNGAPTRAVLMR